MSIALSSLIEMTKEDEALLNQILSSFSCEDDEDIEYFLHKRATEFERISKARTYLICDEKQFRNSDFYLEQLKIYGYVSLALNVLKVPNDMSNRMRKEIDGFSAKIHGIQINSFPCYLIGQLSRNSNVPKEELTGEQLIQYACDVIASAVQSVGGRYVMIECQDNEKLIDFYEGNKFKQIKSIHDNDTEIIQMIRKIQ